MARLGLQHNAYRWICGGVSVNYHALNDSRAGNKTLMDDLLTDNVAALPWPRWVRSPRIAWRRTACAFAQMRAPPHSAVRLTWTNTFARHASCSKRSRRRPGRTPALPLPSGKVQAARLPATQEREARIRAELEQLPEVATAKKRNGLQG
ncbi:MAG: hypothetical protein EPN49_14880 [Rhodanobacter sp.]|nr:MAG: hypothetical protein EPN49_14880 [Rhodanobacter sp.]